MRFFYEVVAIQDLSSLLRLQVNYIGALSKIKLNLEIETKRRIVQSAVLEKIQQRNTKQIDIQSSKTIKVFDFK